MTRSTFILCTVTLTAFAMNALADFTFQTSPTSKQILSASSGLAVRWDVQPGNSPDSNSPAPEMLTVSLGYKDSTGSPQILFPPLNGLDSNVPLQSKQFTWAKFDFNIFTANKEGMPPLDASSQFFIVLADQATGYRSNGQIFSILSSTAAPAPAAPLLAPAGSEPVPSPGAPPAASTPQPPTTGTTPSSSPSGLSKPATGAQPTGTSNGNNSPNSGTVATPGGKPNPASGSSPLSGEESDAPETLVSPIGFQSLLAMNLAFAGAFSCMILF